MNPFDLIGLVIVIPAFMVGIIFSSIYFMQWMTTFLIEIQQGILQGIDDMYIGDE
jgi:hypothetical protein